MFTASVGLKIMSKRVDDVLCYLLGAIFVVDTKPVYNGQPRGITKVAFVDKWPLFRTSETTYPIFTGQIKTGLCRQETTIRSFVFVFFSVRLLSVLHGHLVFIIPDTTANDLRLRRIFYPRFYPLHFFSYLNSSERASICLLMFSAKQGNYWYHFY